MYTPSVPTLKVTPMPFASRSTIPATRGLKPALIMIGRMMVPTRMNMPRPLDAAKITEHTAKNASAMGSGLSPASSAALRMMVFVMPTLVRILPNQPPKIRPAIAVLIRIAPLSSTFPAMVNCSGSLEIKGMPATRAMPTAMMGSARIVGSFLAIISTTQTAKMAKIPIA